MKTALLALGVLCIMGSCSSEMKSSKGIVCDASLNTVSIVTDKNDTLSFNTMDANKEQVDGLLLNDTLEVFYAGKYTPGMQASKLVQYPQAPRWEVTVMSTVVLVLPDTYGVKYKKTASVYLKKVFVQRQLTEARLLLLSFSAPIPHVLNSSSRISNPMKYWRDVVCRRVAMRGM